MSDAQFTLHHYPQQEVLADLLLDQLQNEGKGDPFYKSHVLVRNQGMATWLKRRLAEKTGLAMQVEFPQPHTFLKDVLQSQSVDPEFLKWQIYQTLPSLLDKSNFSPLRDYLQTSDNSQEADLKRYQLSGIISGLFDKYLLYRPDWIEAWQKNEKPKNLPTSEQESWQRELWRSLDTNADAHWSQILLEGKAITLPDDSVKELHVFGISNFAPIYVRFLYQLSHKIPVHIYWMNPVEADEGYWEDSPTRSKWLLAKEFDDPEILNFHNPLLSSFGRLGREFVHTLYGGTEHSYHVQGEYHPWPSPVIRQPQTPLQSLQSSIYNNAPDTALPFALEDPDAPTSTYLSGGNSLSIHSCHTPLRELETLKNYLLTLAEDSPLDAGDVLVMCPDIASYSTAIEAVFGGSSSTPHAHLSYSIGDSHAPATEPTIAAVIQLFTLHTTRFTNNDALALLSTPSIRDYFELSEEHIATLKDWIIKNGIRWGFDSQHVQSVAPQCPETPWTWREGLDRMLLGYAMPNSQNNQSDPVLWKNILPFHDIEAGNARVLGSLCDFLDWCDHIRKDLTQPRTLTDWVDQTRSWIDGGFNKDSDSQQRLQTLYRTLENIQEQGKVIDEKIPAEVFIDHLNNQLENTSTPKGFLSGAITFCEMKPMRAIPSRVVCMLGMNHDTFPRSTSEVPFDLTQQDRHVGDRSTRDDDTYSFLEAILSARESLFISYIGTSIKDGEPRPPSTSLQTLIDYLPEPDQTIHKEKLHAFDPHYFQKDKPISHDAALLAAARVLSTSSSTPQQKAQHSFHITGTEKQTSVDAAALISALSNPARYFLRHCLQARTIYKDNPLETDESIGIEGLTSYHIKNTLLESRHLSEQQIKAWKQEGLVPVGELGAKALKDNIGNLEEQLKDIPETSPMEITVTIGGLTITGNAPIAEIDDEPCVVITCASKGNAKNKLTAWIYQLLASVHLEAPVPSRLYGIDKNKINLINLAKNNDALEHLTALIELYHAAHSQPLAHFPKTAEAFVSAPRKDESDDEYDRKRRGAALKMWEPGYQSTGESEDEAVKHLFDTSDLFTDDFISISELIWEPILLT